MRLIIMILALVGATVAFAAGPYPGVVNPSALPRHQDGCEPGMGYPDCHPGESWRKPIGAPQWWRAPQFKH